MVTIHSLLFQTVHLAELNSEVSSLRCFDRYEQLACLQTASVMTFVVPGSLAAFHFSLE